MTLTDVVLEQSNDELSSLLVDRAVMQRGIPDFLAGKVWGLSGAPGAGLTRLSMTLLASQVPTGQIAVLETRGWFCPLVAWESGVEAERLVIVRAPDTVSWARVAATLVEGIPALYAEVPDRINDAALRKLSALARRSGTRVLLRSFGEAIPTGVAQLQMTIRDLSWEGTDAGHGKLMRRRFMVEMTGKAVGGALRRIEMEDDGANTVRVVPGLAAASVGRIAG